MIGHLSSEQISRLMIGSATSEEEQHAGKCAVCAAELAQLRETLSLFRDSVQHYASQSGGEVAPNPAFLQSDPLASRMHPFRWILAAAAVLIVLVAIPVYKNMSDRHRATEALKDTLLLEEVNAHLSRTVPLPMEPLMDLVSGTSADGVGGR